MNNCNRYFWYAEYNIWIAIYLLNLNFFLYIKKYYVKFKVVMNFEVKFKVVK